MFITKKSNLIIIFLLVLFFGYFFTNVVFSNTLPIPNLNNAQFVSQSIPTIMTAGQNYPVSITVKNTGTTTWSKGSLYRLGSQNPPNNATWGNTLYYSSNWPNISRIELADNEQVLPEATKIFSFNVTAPASSGNYNFQWKMVKDGIEWFGDLTPNILISVLAPSSLDLFIESERVFPSPYYWGTGVAFADFGGSAGKGMTIGACEPYVKNPVTGLYDNFVGEAIAYDSSNKIAWERTSSPPMFVTGIDAGDINNDGYDEVVIGYMSPTVKPVVAEAVDKNGVLLWSYNYYPGPMIRAVRIGELSSAPGKEVLLAGSGKPWDANVTQNGAIILLNSSGKEIWRKTTSAGKMQAARIADVNMDGINEIIVVGGYGTDGNVRLLDRNGNELWKVNVGEDALGVGVGDITSVPGLEIVVPSAKRGVAGNEDKITLLNSSGGIIWQKTLAVPPWSATTGDIDMDGKNEIFIGYGTHDSSPVTNDYGGVMIFNSKGEIIADVPTGSSIKFIEFGDANGDGKKDIVASCDCGRAYIISSRTQLPPISKPTVNLLANNSNGPITIPYNTSATLSWTSSNVTSCTASNAWSGSKSTSGSASTGNLISSKTYIITCTGSGGSVSDSVTVNVTSNCIQVITPAQNIQTKECREFPTPCDVPAGWMKVDKCPASAVNLLINGSNGPISIPYNTAATLSWTSTNATSCTASNAWSGIKPTSGSASTGNLISPKIYTITCIGSGGSVSDSVTVNLSDSGSGDGGGDGYTPAPTPTPTPIIIPTLPTNPTQTDYQNLLDALLKQLAFLQGQLSTQQGSSNYQFTHNLQLGDSGEDVTQLQTFLKTQGTSIYPEGLITGYFGNLTKLAVQRFQKKYGIVSFGNEWTTGYGMVGPKTRAKLNELL